MDIFKQAGLLASADNAPIARRKGKARRKKQSYILRREGKVVSEVRLPSECSAVKKRSARSIEYVAPFDRDVDDLPEGCQGTNDDWRKMLGRYTYDKRSELLKVLGRYYDRNMLTIVSVNYLLSLLAEVRKNGAKELKVHEICEWGTESRLGKFSGSFKTVSSVHAVRGKETVEPGELELIGPERSLVVKPVTVEVTK